MDNPESKRLIPVELEMRRLMSFSYDPDEQGRRQKAPMEGEGPEQTLPPPTFLPSEMKADFSDF
jgi:hypothetical protein